MCAGQRANAAYACFNAAIAAGLVIGANVRAEVGAGVGAGVGTEVGGFWGIFASNPLVQTHSLNA